MSSSMCAEVTLQNSFNFQNDPRINHLKNDQYDICLSRETYLLKELWLLRTQADNDERFNLRVLI